MSDNSVVRMREDIIDMLHWAEQDPVQNEQLLIHLSRVLYELERIL